MADRNQWIGAQNLYPCMLRLFKDVALFGRFCFTYSVLFSLAWHHAWSGWAILSFARFVSVRVRVT